MRLVSSNSQSRIQDLVYGKGSVGVKIEYSNSGCFIVRRKFL